MQLGLMSNFVADEMGLSAAQNGLLEAARESCGIIGFAVLAALAGLAEPLVGAGMLLLFGVGLASYYFVPDLQWLIILSVAWSLGFHVWMPLPNSMGLALAEKGRAGYRLGQIQAAGNAGMAIGLIAALVMTLGDSIFRPAELFSGAIDVAKPWIPMRPQFIVAGAASVVAAAACLAIPRKIKTPGPRFVFRREYSLFYGLCFLEGWRKQIFIAFAGYLLVKKYQTPLYIILLLWIAVQTIGYVAAPRVGKLVDRIGERKVLMFYFGSLALFFVGYATIKVRSYLFVIYVIDNAFFVFHVALNTYVNRIAPKNEHTQTLSMGVAMNHIAAVVTPLTGGLVWKYLGYQWTFLIGAGAAALSVFVSMRVPPHTGHIELPPTAEPVEIEEL